MARWRHEGGSRWRVRFDDPNLWGGVYLRCGMHWWLADADPKRRPASRRVTVQYDGRARSVAGAKAACERKARELSGEGVRAPTPEATP